MNQQLRSGAAEIDITPPIGVALAGSLTRREATGVLDPLHARAVVLESGGTRLAFVLLDLIMLSNEDAAAARKLFGEAAGLPAEHVCISCTHTHSGPAMMEMFESPRESEFIEKTLIPRIGELGDKAAERLQPAKAAWANGWEPRAAFNRRFHMTDGSVKMNPGCANPDIIRVAGPTDPQIPMLMVASTDGEPIAVVVNFSLHYIGGFGGGLISADYFGAFADQMKEIKGDDFVALLTHGASGDINNIDVSHRPPPRQPGEQVQRVARWITEQVQTEWEKAEFVESALIATSQAVYDQVVRKPEGSEIEKAQRQWEDEGLPIIDRLYGRERLELLNWPDSIPMVIQTLRVGDFGAATMTGEIFCRFGLDLKYASPFSVTAVIELANGYGGYVPTRVDYELGGYETWLARSAWAAPGTGEELVAMASTGLRSLADISTKQGA